MSRFKVDFLVDYILYWKMNTSKYALGTWVTICVMKDYFLVLIFFLQRMRMGIYSVGDTYNNFKPCFKYVRVKGFHKKHDRLSSDIYAAIQALIKHRTRFFC